MILSSNNRFIRVPLVLILCCLFFLSEGQNAYRFERFSTLDGMGNNYVSDIKTDSSGYLWMATFDGLSRFDGYEFVNFKPGQNNPYYTGSNIISFIYPDNNGKIWFGTVGTGLSVIEPETGDFKNYHSLGPKGQQIAGNNVTTICQSDHHIWIGTSNGLSILNTLTDSITNFKLSEFGVSDQITALFEYQNGYVWLGTEQGLQLLKLQDNKLIEYPNFNHLQNRSRNYVNQIYKDDNDDFWIIHSNYVQQITTQASGQLLVALTLNRSQVSELTGLRHYFNAFTQIDANNYWVGTNNGLINLNTEDQLKISWSKNDLFNAESLSGNNITSMHKDREGVIWIGTRYSGLNKYDPFKQPFAKYMKRLGESFTMRSNDVRTLLEDRDGNIWIGYRDEGLDRFNIEQGEVDHFTSRQDDAKKIPSNVIRGMYLDKEGQIWLGSSGGVSKLVKNGTSYHFENITPDLIQQLGTMGSVYEFFEDSKNRFWIGSTGGLIQYDRQTGEAHIYQHSNEGNFGNRNFIRGITEDDKGNIWIATDGAGIDMLNPETGQFTNYQSVLTDKTSLSNNKAYSVLFDTQKRLWVGTHSGLNCLEPGQDKFRLYSEFEGLVNNVVYSVNEDREGYIWVSTANGLSRISPDTKSINNYLQGFEFSDDAWWQNFKGELLFGGINGFYKFDPGLMVNNQVAPRVYVQGFSLLNEPIIRGQEINNRVLLKKPISQTDSIELAHYENFFTFDLLAISLSKPQQIHYQYQLEGFNDKWIDADFRDRKAVFTNVPYGHYRFKLRAANADGKWSETKLVHITIHPAYYQTIWFKITMSVALILLLLVGYRLRLRNLTLQKAKLEFEVEEKTKNLRSQKEAIEQQNTVLENQKKEIEEQRDKVVEMTKQVHEADERKIRFFTSISHEIRTPLTLISAPIDKLLSSMDSKDKHLSDLKLVQRNTKRLLNLVNQLLDFRKIDTGHMSVQSQKGKLDDCIQNIFGNFKPLADKKEIGYTLQISSDSFELCFDADVIEKVAVNLISNALKYTPEKGMVKVLLTRNADKHITLSVCDSGPGIKEEQQSAIFKRFYRDENSANKAAGTGIGLALAKELAILHGGDIYLKQNPEGGSCFEFEIPVIESSELIAETQFIDSDFKQQAITTEVDDYSVLVIEDNDDLRDFIKSSIQAKEIYEAPDGEKGVQLALDKIPDIIVSDVLMPGKNGYEVCRLLKQDERTNHIPILLLTALGAEENQQIGIDCGADDYIVKPFNHRILAGKIHNVMQARQQFKANLQKKLAPGSQEVKSDWKQNLPPFLNKVINLIYENVEDSDFGVEELGKQLGMSRSTLYRKLKSISDKSAIEFIREVRMRIAYELIQDDPHMQVAELAMKVGFEDADYFRQCFKKQFGKTPRDIV
ncbi:MAG: ATP-binding protein [Carboxylicivirga sp.]|nr:ATP-binding protein [Carboxylicivirga sp.]